MAMRKVAWGAAAGLVAGVAACAMTSRLLPERYAVNLPLRSVIGGGGAAPEDEVFGTRIRAADGFSVGLYAEGLKGARFLHFTQAGDLLVSTPSSGRVMRVEKDADGDGRADGVRALLEGLDRPHGLDIHDGWLYVAETGAVGRVRFDAESGETSGDFERLVEDLPAGGGHWTRTVGLGPDGFMYVSIGSSCNVCIEEDPRRAAIVRYRADGSEETLYATGLRNSVGFDWRPADGGLYATDNGRDLLGDDFPPDELNRIVEGGFYGWPYAHGNRVPDPEHGEGHEERIEKSIPPVHRFDPHNAPLGMTFVRGERVPAEYRGAALVALHGSWNSTVKVGYKVVSLHWEGPDDVEERDFVWGFEVDEDVIGRPVDVAEGPDGAFYVSDDYANAVYRVVYDEGAAGGGR